jgi:hypothetical protein
MYPAMPPRTGGGAGGRFWLALQLIPHPFSWEEKGQNDPPLFPKERGWGEFDDLQLIPHSHYAGGPGGEFA